VNTEIEIHDSKVADITYQDNTVVVHFLAAYLHKSEGRPGYDRGTGWAQEGFLIFDQASVNGKFPEWPCDLMDGELILGSQRHDNSIAVPLEFKGPTVLHLICDCVHKVTVTSLGARLKLVGNPRFVDEFIP